MTALHRTLEASRLAEGPAWTLLRADHRAVAVGVLGEHLGGEVRRLAAPVLAERLEEDLVVLRDHGFALPQTAQAYLKEWTDQGWLVRRPAEGREETLELSDGALAALRFVAGVAEARRTVTESRLVTIVERLRALAVATDPDASSRLAALMAERDRLEARIAQVEAGEVDVLAPERALEQARDLLALAAELPADFARVRAELERINVELRRRLVEDPDERGAVLDDVFRGVDHLADSDAGRSFDGFHALMLDPELSADVEGTVAAVLDRPFATALGEGRRSLRRLMPTLQDSSTEVHDVMTSFSRSLRRFVQSRELGEERHLHRLLQDAQRDALAVAERVPPFRRLDLTLDLSSVPVGSVAALVLHDPADARVAADVLPAAVPPVDVAALRELARASEIDLRELQTHVDEVLVTQGTATIGEVLAARPATQGVASVVGLLVLAEEQGTRLEGEEETVAWTSTTGVERCGTVPRYLFVRRTAEVVR
ncbi:DUF3375 domain-containing protein [Cellulomonas marina]|uniref:DUF3375 domain-containing protein n=1 Tax=Cellulomonas marina TaxID=988821 RepID=A0A1I1AFW0_9CELL|nr:DUF3375 domain-containing protein [Cellulomonas marina]GIG30212.1 hypothetical protein Cma02nite_28120 [Cellulomonas marina]SFB36915.1 Protein of unknown function [Cellulomonas marina]